MISGNANYGVQLSAQSKGNRISGNFIGTDPAGQRALGNQFSGVRVESSVNTIGGSASGSGNLISGNGQDGIFLVAAACSNNAVLGNLIGTTASGNAALGNRRAGLGISGAAANLIGGASVPERNVISANADAGVYLIGSGASGNVIWGNVIGANAGGTGALGNGLEGIFLDGASGNFLGGSTSGAGNLISGNGTRGMFLTNASFNVIQGNRIGVGADGSSPLPNTFHNVEFESGASNNTLGGALGAGNTVAYAPGIYAGVRVRAGSLNNAILGNALFSNGALGIDLGPAGVTPNDPCDTDTGANQLQNFPLLSQAVSGLNTGVRGNLNSAASTTFRLQFFANPACDVSGNGEGQFYLGDAEVVTDGSCNVSFVATLPVPVPVGYRITATATDPANNTSEYSACVAVEPVPTLSLTLPASRQVQLSWTNSATGFVLKQTGSLSPPVQWTATAGRPVDNGSQWALTLPITTSNLFYVLSFE